MVLVCNHREHAVQVVEALRYPADPVMHLRMARMHGRHPIDWDELHRDPRWEQAVAAVKGYEEMPELDLQ
jgi:beta-N-acetylhexosaminidase